MTMTGEIVKRFRPQRTVIGRNRRAWENGRAGRENVYPMLDGGALIGGRG
jgi:hypothetical protein